MRPSDDQWRFVDRRGGERRQPGLQVGHDLGAKKPQLLQQQANVVTSAAQYRMQRIAQGSFEWIAAQVVDDRSAGLCVILPCSSSRRS